MKPFRPNSLIKLVRTEVVKESAGNWESEPTKTKYDLWAEVGDPANGFRSYDAQTQLGQVQSFKLWFRFDLHPNGDWKIEFRGKEWTIQKMDQDGLFYWIITANHK